MITNSRVRYAFQYCRDQSYSSFVNGVKCGSTITRICYIGIEGIRAFLSLAQGVPRLDFYTRNERSWTPVASLARKRALDLRSMLHSAQEFEHELAETFFFAYPKAEESYYEDLPNHHDVLSLLNSNPTSDQVKEYMLLCTYDDMVAVDDADGIATIVCEDGTVCVPYDCGRNSKEFQMYRAKFHPDSLPTAIFEGFFDKCYAIKSRIMSISFSGFLSRIENLMP